MAGAASLVEGGPVLHNFKLWMDASLTVYAFVMQKILGRADSIKFKKEKIGL